MRLRIISIVLLLFSGKCFGQWTDEQKTLAALSMAALAVDYGQTKYISAPNSGFHEMNPMLPRHPTMNQVNRHFILTPLIAYLILDNISSDDRTTALKVITIMQVGVVAHNFSLGIGIRF